MEVQLLNSLGTSTLGCGMLKVARMKSVAR